MWPDQQIVSGLRFITELKIWTWIWILHRSSRNKMSTIVVVNCSGQLIPDTALSFSSAMAGAKPSLNR